MPADLVDMFIRQIPRLTAEEALDAFDEVTAGVYYGFRLKQAPSDLLRRWRDQAYESGVPREAAPTRKRMSRQDLIDRCAAMGVPLEFVSPPGGQETR